MQFSKLVESLPEKRSITSGSPEITSLAYDSRRVSLGSLFICIRGEKFDGHEFVGAAVSAGASAVVVEDVDCVPEVPSIAVPDARKAMASLANTFYDFPSRKLKLAGVTGTKGKTTTTYLIQGILSRAYGQAGVIGTLGARLGELEIPLDRTTPESVDLQEILAEMVRYGASAAVMEVSSHALALRRTEGCEYDVGIFTNLTHDHLDFHGTLEDYLATKLTLFSGYPPASGKKFTGVINVDDPSGRMVVETTHGNVVTYGIQKAADIRAQNISASPNGVSFDLEGMGPKNRIDLKLGGVFNVYNALAAIGTAVALGIDMETVKPGLESVSSVPGRFQSVDCGQDFGVVVDYAHSPDSLENILRSARELTSGRLLVVFGCGGDRDTAKRPVMGRIAAELADVCVVTSDNPRSEEPKAIIDQILAGMENGKADVCSLIDRREAIERALSLARPGDLVVIAGKGHETYQIFKDRTVHFDDREVVREALSGQ